MENIAGCNYAMRRFDTDKIEQNTDISWMDNAANAVQKVFSSTEDFSNLFEDEVKS